MTALLFLIAAAGLLYAARAAAPVWTVAAALALAMLAGLTFPDIDQPLPLDHRSALTHSALPALLTLARRWLIPLAAGLAIGIGFHLAADIFPNAMIGYATVKLPFGGSIGAQWSYYWLLGNAALCLGGGLALLRRSFAAPRWRWTMLAALSCAGAVYLVGVDGGWPVLGIALAAMVLALGVRRAYARVGRARASGLARD